MSVLKVEKNPPIQSGKISLNYTPDDEKFTYDGHVKVKIGFISKNIPFSEVISIPRDIMRSSALTVGSVIEFKGVKVEVISNDGSTALVNFEEEDVKGKANLDVTGEYIDVISINAKASVQGFMLKIAAHRV